jgi:hypothetical protein
VWQKRYKSSTRWAPGNSEINVQSKLNNARLIQLSAENAERLGRLKIHRWIRKLNDVEQVEKLPAERCAPSFVQSEFSRNSQIHVPSRQSTQLSAATAGRVRAHKRRPERFEDCRWIREQVQAGPTFSRVAVDAGLRFYIAPYTGVDVIAKRILRQQHGPSRVCAPALPEFLARAG